MKAALHSRSNVLLSLCVFLFVAMHSMQSTQGDSSPLDQQGSSHAQHQQEHQQQHEGLDHDAGEIFHNEDETEREDEEYHFSEAQREDDQDLPVLNSNDMHVVADAEVVLGGGGVDHHLDTPLTSLSSSSAPASPSSSSKKSSFSNNKNSNNKKGHNQQHDPHSNTASSKTEDIDKARNTGNSNSQHQVPSSQQQQQQQQHSSYHHARQMMVTILTSNDGRLVNTSVPRYINRELSWLAFNERVLAEAESLRHPILERLRFLSISHSNLDEFYMVRVAGLTQLITSSVSSRSADGLTPSQQLAALHEACSQLQGEQQRVWRSLKDQIATETGIMVVDPKDVTEGDKAYLERYFLSDMWPLLTPQSIDPSHPFPFIPGKGMGLLFTLSRKRSGGAQQHHNHHMHNSNNNNNNNGGGGTSSFNVDEFGNPIDHNANAHSSSGEIHGNTNNGAMHWSAQNDHQQTHFDTNNNNNNNGKKTKGKGKNSKQQQQQQQQQQQARQTSWADNNNNGNSWNNNGNNNNNGGGEGGNSNGNTASDGLNNLPGEMKAILLFPASMSRFIRLPSNTGPLHNTNAQSGGGSSSNTGSGTTGASSASGSSSSASSSSSSSSSNLASSTTTTTTPTTNCIQSTSTFLGNCSPAVNIPGATRASAAGMRFDSAATNGRNRLPIRFILAEHVVEMFLHYFFPDFNLKESGMFRVLRDSEVEIDEEAVDLVRMFETALKRRRKGDVIHLAVDSSMPRDMISFIAKKVHVPYELVSIMEGLVGLSDVRKMIVDDRKEFQFQPFVVRFPERITVDFGGDIFAAIRAKDLIVHHPYESFDVVLQFIRQAARDPNVVAIKQTLYRTSDDSPIVRELIEAAESGKTVTALIELKARFDEEANIRWARDMQRAGVHVVYGFLELKTHAKVALVVRKEDKGLRSYVHVGTGNYHPVTAKVYTDLSYFSADPALCRDAARLFNYMTGYGKPQELEMIAIAPITLRSRLEDHIHQEIQNARNGLPAQIWAKMNALVDTQLIELLYEASEAGVSIDLIVRGMCALRPGVPGLSSRIRVKSVIGRFLEHSRIVVFANAHTLPSEHARVYISSADWMTRNLDWRVEALVPLFNSTVHDQVLNEIMVHTLRDTVNSWILLSDGEYMRGTEVLEEKAEAKRKLRLVAKASAHAAAIAAIEAAGGNISFNTLESNNNNSHTLSLSDDDEDDEDMSTGASEQSKRKPSDSRKSEDEEDEEEDEEDDDDEDDDDDDDDDDDEDDDIGMISGEEDSHQYFMTHPSLSGRGKSKSGDIYPQKYRETDI